MVHFEKSQPAPDCLAIEKGKKSGDYKCGDVLKRLKTDFKNKCYICEQKAPITINVEHFVSHKGDNNLKFDWNNLFWSCGHCNNSKLGSYDNLLNCTVSSDNVEMAIYYNLNCFPVEKPSFETLNDDVKTLQTKELLEAVYLGTTKLKKIESANLRDAVLREIESFQKWLKAYFESNEEEMKAYALLQIKEHLCNASAFTAFKRWIIRDNPSLLKEFEAYLV
jgi:hypothetical protein